MTSPRRTFLALFVFAVAFLASSPAWAAPTFKQIFDPYIGAWTGTFSVALPSGASRVIQARHEYEWDGNILRGIHAFEEAGMLNYATSETFVDKTGRLFRKVSYTDQTPSTYYGEFKEGRVTWLPTKVLEASRFQTVEHFEKDAQGRPAMRVIRTENMAKPGASVPDITNYEGRFSPAPPKTVR